MKQEPNKTSRRAPVPARVQSVMTIPPSTCCQSRALGQMQEDFDVRPKNRAFHQPADMLTVAGSVMPAAIGAGSVLLIRHLVRALSAPAPAEILGAAVPPDELIVTALIRRRYYRSIASFLPTLLLISGFMLGAVIPSLLWLNKPIPTVEAPMLTGLVCGLVTWTGGWLDRKLWEKYFASVTARTLLAN